MSYLQTIFTVVLADYLHNRTCRTFSRLYLLALADHFHRFHDHTCGPFLRWYLHTFSPLYLRTIFSRTCRHFQSTCGSFSWSYLRTIFTIMLADHFLWSCLWIIFLVVLLSHFNIVLENRSRFKSRVVALATCSNLSFNPPVGRQILLKLRTSCAIYRYDCGHYNASAACATLGNVIANGLQGTGNSRTSAFGHDRKCDWHWLRTVWSQFSSFLFSTHEVAHARVKNINKILKLPAIIFVQIFYYRSSVL